MKKGFKRLTAVAMATAMVLGGSMTAFADEGSQDGAGHVTNYVNKKIFSVEVPTAATAQTFEFVVDPYENLKETSFAAISGTATVADNTKRLYFATSGGAVWKNESDKIVVTNKSSMDVNVDIVATVNNATGIKLAADATAANLSGAAIYLAVNHGVSGTSLTPKAITKEAASASAVGKVETTMAGLATNYEEVVKSGTSGMTAEYEYRVKDDATGWKQYVFQLTGDCSKSDAWRGVSSVPSVTVTWKLTNPEATGYGTWDGSTLWLGANSTTGFSAAPTAVEFSTDGGVTYTAITGTFDANTKWYSLTWDTMTAAGATNDNSATCYVRITDGRTKYTVKILP